MENEFNPEEISEIVLGEELKEESKPEIVETDTEDYRDSQFQTSDNEDVIEVEF